MKGPILFYCFLYSAVASRLLAHPRTEELAGGGGRRGGAKRRQENVVAVLSTGRGPGISHLGFRPSSCSNSLSIRSKNRGSSVRRHLYVMKISLVVIEKLFFNLKILRNK